MAHDPAQLRAVIVGLGQAGSRFDEEPGRTSVWSHAGAYLHLAKRFELCAAAEPSPLNAEAFAARCPQIPIVSNVHELVERHRPEIASICTPARSEERRVGKECGSRRVRRQE